MEWIELEHCYKKDYTITEITDLLAYADDMGGPDVVRKILADVYSYKASLKKEIDIERKQYKEKNDLIIEKNQKREYVIMNLLFMLAGTHEYRQPVAFEILPNRKIVLLRDIRNGNHSITLLILHKGYSSNWNNSIRFFNDDGEFNQNALDAISQAITITQNGEKYEVNGCAHIKDLV